MTIKQQLIQELESTSESLLAETLDFLRFLKTKQDKSPDFSRHLEKSTRNLTPQPPDPNPHFVGAPSSLRGNGENSKPLKKQERGLERGSPNPVTSKEKSQLEITSPPFEESSASIDSHDSQEESSSEPSQLPYSPASGRSILRHAGTWAGDDYQECLQLMYASRGKAKFDDDNDFE